MEILLSGTLVGEFRKNSMMGKACKTGILFECIFFLSAPYPTNSDRWAQWDFDLVDPWLAKLIQKINFETKKEGVQAKVDIVIRCQ